MSISLERRIGSIDRIEIEYNRNGKHKSTHSYSKKRRCLEYDVFIYVLQIETNITYGMTDRHTPLLHRTYIIQRMPLNFARTYEENHLSTLHKLGYKKFYTNLYQQQQQLGQKREREKKKTTFSYGTILEKCSINKMTSRLVWNERRQREICTNMKMNWKHANEDEKINVKWNEWIFAFFFFSLSPSPSLFPSLLSHWA